MHVTQIKNNNYPKSRTLIVPKEELKRLQKILTKDNDDRAALEEIKQIKNEQQAESKKMVETFNNTLLNNRRKKNEQKLKLLADIEAKEQERDKIIKLEILERRNMIVEKAQEKKWLAKDWTKMITRVEQNMEVLRERAMQIEFNKEIRSNELEEERLLKIEQNLEAEKYKKDQYEQKLKEIEMKKIKTTDNLKILKEQENRKREKELKLMEEQKAELQRISKEIMEDDKKKIIQIQTTKSSIIKNLEENREIVTKNNKLLKLKEQKQNSEIAINDEAKKRIDKLIKCRQIELIKEKLALSNKMTEKLTHYNQVHKEMEITALQKAIGQKEHQYQIEQLQKEEAIQKIRKDLEYYKKKFDEETKIKKEQSELSREWELKRRLRETEILRSLEELHRKTKISEINQLCGHLNTQSNNNRAASIADKQEDLKQYNKMIKLWREEDEKYFNYIKNLTEKYEKTGISPKPLTKALKSYEKNHALLVDAADKRNSEVNSKCLTSPIVYLY